MSNPFLATRRQTYRDGLILAQEAVRQRGLASSYAYAQKVFALVLADPASCTDAVLAHIDGIREAMRAERPIAELLTDLFIELPWLFRAQTAQQGVA